MASTNTMGMEDQAQSTVMEVSSTVLEAQSITDTTVLEAPSTTVTTVLMSRTRPSTRL